MRKRAYHCHEMGRDARTYGPVRSVAKAMVPTAYQLLETLVAARMLRKSAGRAYELGPAIGALTDALTRRLAPPAFLLEPLHELAAATRETVYLSRWQDDDVVILATVEGVHELRVAGLHSGTRGHAHARASGKVLLAHLPTDERERHLAAHPLTSRTPATITEPELLEAELRRVRRTGVGWDVEEFAEGVCGVSAPVLERGVAIATYTLVAPSVRFAHERDRYRAAVQAAAAAAAR